MPIDVNVPTKIRKIPNVAPKKSGSGLGSALGAAAGLGAGIGLAAATGGFTAPLMLSTAGSIAGLTGGGMALGGLTGGMIKKGKEGQQGYLEQAPRANPVGMSTPIERKQAILEQSPLATLKSALESLPKAPPGLQEQALPPLLKAYQMESMRGGA